MARPHASPPPVPSVFRACVLFSFHTLNLSYTDVPMSSEAQPECETQAGEINEDQRKRLEAAMEYIQKNCHTGAGLDDAAKAAGLSKFHFHRIFHRYFGKTVKRIVTECQVEMAKKLLLAGVPTKETGERCGFANQSHFTSRFKLITGQPPRKWTKAQLSSRNQEKNLAWVI